MRSRITAPLLAAALLLTGCAEETFQPTHTDVVPLEGDATVGQTLRPASGRIARVDVLVATYGTPADPGGVLEVELREEPSGRLLADTALPGSTLSDNAWVAVPFPDSPVATGPQARVTLRWRGGTPLALRANVPPAGLDAGDRLDGQPRLRNDAYPGGELLRDGRPAPGDLAFRVTSGGRLSGLASLARSVGVLAGALRDRPLFAIVWGLLLAAAAGLTVGAARRARLSPPARPAPAPSASRGGDDPHGGRAATPPARPDQPPRTR